MRTGGDAAVGVPVIDRRTTAGEGSAAALACYRCAAGGYVPVRMRLCAGLTLRAVGFARFVLEY